MRLFLIGVLLIAHTQLLAQIEYSFPCGTPGFFDSYQSPGISYKDFTIKTGTKCGREIDLCIDFHTYQVPDRIALIDSIGEFILISPFIGGSAGSGFPDGGFEAVMNSCWFWDNGSVDVINSGDDLYGPNWAFDTLTTFNSDGSARILYTTTESELTIRAYYNPVLGIRTFFQIYIHCIDESIVENSRVFITNEIDTCGLGESIVSYSLIEGDCIDTLIKDIYTDQTLLDQEVYLYGCKGDKVYESIYDLVPSISMLDDVHVYPSEYIDIDSLSGSDLYRFEVDYRDCTSYIDVYVELEKEDTISITHYVDDRGIIDIESILIYNGLNVNDFRLDTVDTGYITVNDLTWSTFLQSSYCLTPSVNLTVIDNYDLYIPNVISKSSLNEDNRIFKIYDRRDIIIVDVCMIFDRWGNLVYSIDNRSIYWDASSRQSGVYTYIIQCKGRTYSGDITVIN